MSRPDWGALQQEYIAEYTRSGISPVAWCEARGLNYATARRYIKKTPKNAHHQHGVHEVAHGHFERFAILVHLHALLTPFPAPCGQGSPWA